jgi:type IV pilus modification protein PilV
MNCNAPRLGTTGFALAEALVALLLLAIAMLGAEAALVESLAAQRAALLRTQAADLASNLAEALRSAPDAVAATTEIASWAAAAQRLLPAAELLAIPRAPALPAQPGMSLPSRLDIQLRWSNGRSLQPAQLTVPLGFSTPTEVTE